jgi:hypothetical protein
MVSLVRFWACLDLNLEAPPVTSVSFGYDSFAVLGNLSVGQCAKIRRMIQAKSGEHTERDRLVIADNNSIHTALVPASAIDWIGKS